MVGVSRLLVVEDDVDLRHTLVEQLGPSSLFDVASCGTAAEARDALRDGRTDLVIMESGLPDMNGREAARLVREDGFRGPIIMLATSNDDAGAEVDAETSVSECVVKPFKFALLLARIRAQLRAHEDSGEAALEVGPYTFHPGTKVLVGQTGTKLKLTEKEAAILRYLHRAAPTIVGRDELLQEVWGYSSAVTTHTLETHVYRLRQKIETDPSAARILVTEPGGYRLMP